MSFVEHRTLAGTPTTTVLGGTSLFTNAAAPTKESLPTLIPGIIMAPVAMTAYSSIVGPCMQSEGG